MKKNKKWFLLTTTSFLLSQLGVVKQVFSMPKELLTVDPLSHSQSCQTPPINKMINNQITFEKIGEMLNLHDFKALLSIGKTFASMEGLRRAFNEKELNLSGKIISDEDFESLFKKNSLFGEIKSLDLSGTSFNHELLEKLPSTLEKLRLNNTKLSLSDISRIHRLKKLKSLDLGNNWFLVSAFYDDATIRNIVGPMGPIKINAEQRLDIIENVLKMTQLKSLNLCSNYFDDSVAYAIAENAENMTQLIRLDLSYNSIGNEGASAIAESAHKMPKLTRLDLNFNDIGNEGASTIARKLTQLTSLNLGYNKIGSEGASAIAKKLTQLINLDLAGNGFSLAVVKDIAENMTHLRSLNLASSRIDKKAALTIAENVQKMPKLTSLDLSHNIMPEINDAWLVALADKLAQLKTLKLANTKISNANIDFLREMMTSTIIHQGVVKKPKFDSD